MPTFTTNGPGGTSFDIDWQGDAPPTDDQLGSIFAYNHAVPASSYQDPNASPSEQSVPSNDLNYPSNTRNQNDGSPIGTNQASVQPASPSPTTAPTVSPTSGRNMPLYRDLLGIDKTLAEQATGQWPIMPTAGTSSSTAPPNSTPGGRSTNPSTYPSTNDYTGQIPNNRNSSSYDDPLGIGNTRSGQAGGMKAKPSPTTGQASNVGASAGSTQDYGSYDSSLFVDAHSKRMSSASNGWSPPRPGTRQRRDSFGGPDMDATPNNSISGPHAKTDATHTNPAMWTPNYPTGNAEKELKDLYPATAETLRRLGLTGMIIQGVGNDYSSAGTH